MSQIGKYSTDNNFGSFHTLYIAKASDLPEIDPNIDNLLIVLPRPFDEIFTAIYFTDGTGEYTASQGSNENGTFWQHSITFSIPKDRIEVTRALKQFEKKKIVCLIVLHNEDEKKLIGSQSFPLQFISEIKIGKEVSEKNERVLQITGTSPHEAPYFGGYVEDPGDPVVLPDVDVSDLLLRVIALEQNVNAFFLQLTTIQNNVNTNISLINQTINNLNTEYNALEGIVGSLTITVNQHTEQITQINQTLQYIQSLINQINVGIQAIIDRRRIISVNLAENAWTNVVHNFALIDQDAFTHRIAVEGETAFFPVKSINNNEISIYSTEALSAKVVLIALAAITSGKISTQTVNLIANTWVQVVHNFDLTDANAFTIRLVKDEETIHAPSRAVNSNTLEIYSTETTTVKAVMIGV